MAAEKKELARSVRFLRKTLKFLRLYNISVTWALIGKIFLLLGSISTGFQLLLVDLYAVKEGLPYFELIEALGINLVLLIALTLIVTCVGAVIVILPGLMRFSDDGLLQTADKHGLPHNQLVNFNSYRITVTAGIPFALWIPLSFTIYSIERNPADLWIAIGSSAAMLAALLFVGLMARSGRAKAREALEAIKDESVRDRVDVGWRGLFNVVALSDIGFFLLFFLIADLLVRSEASAAGIPAPTSAFGWISLYFVLSLVAAGLFAICRAWAVLASFKVAFGAFIVATVVLFCFYPGVTNLIGSQLRQTNQGGGILVAFQVSEEFFEDYPGARQDRTHCKQDKASCAGPLLTVPIKLSLLGTDMVFFRLSELTINGETYLGSQVQIDRTRIRDVVYLGERKKKETEEVNMAAEPDPSAAPTRPDT